MAETEPIAYQLAKFVAEAKYEDLPASAVEHMKTYVLDGFAAGFVGSDKPWAKIILEMIRKQGGNPESSLFGQSEKATASQAALFNGTAIGGFESEHLGHGGHPGGTVPPATIAVAERERVSGKQFLLALALGYEVVCRIGDAEGGEVETVRGFHNPAANGPFSSAASVGKLLGLDTMAQARALGIAGSYAGGLVEYAWHGEMTKRMHLGHASQGGLEAATLASLGFTGPLTILEGPYGYYNGFSPNPHIDRVLPGLGEEWRLESLMIKAYPCHASSQALVDTIQKLKREHEIDPDAVTRLHLRANRSIEERFLDQAPESEMGAQYSTPFNMAVAIYRDLDHPSQYDESVLHDKKILDLAQRVTWEEVKAGEGVPDEIEVVVGGSTHKLEVGPYKGSPRDPAVFADIEDKFRRFSEHVLKADQQQQIIDMVRSIDTLADFGELGALLRG